MLYSLKNINFRFTVNVAEILLLILKCTSNFNNIPIIFFSYI